jgi:hypothetical protein
MPRRTYEGDVIVQYVNSTRRARMVNAGSAIYIEAYALLSTGQTQRVILRATPAAGTAAIVPDQLHNLVFDPDFYMQKYPDVRLAYHGNPELATNHWLIHGIAAGRQGSRYVSARYYEAKNPDIRVYAKGSYWRALWHWLHYGILTNREAVAP